MSDSYWTSSANATSRNLTQEDIDKAMAEWDRLASLPTIEIISLREWKRRRAAQDS